jgi:flagellar biosynthetic protein FliO
MLIQKSYNYWHKVFSIFILLSIIALSASDVTAQIDSTAISSTAGQPALQNSNELHFGKALLRTVFALALVILFLVIFLFGLRWLQNQTRASSNRTHTLQIQDSMALGPKKQLYLIQVVDRVLLIGSSESSISLLLELSDEEKQKLLDKKCGKTMSFSKALASQVAKLGGAHKS